MKKHNILTKSLAAIVAVTLTGQAAYAATYADGDLILGFRATGGVGSNKNVVVNIGQASVYTGAASRIPVVSGTTSIGADLTTAFTTWSTHRNDGARNAAGQVVGSDVIWSVTGTTGSFAPVGSDPAKTLYATRAISTPGSHPSAWLRASDTAQGATTSLMRAFGIQYTTYTDTANGGVIQLSNDINSYSSYQPGGTTVNAGPSPGISFKAYNPSAESTSSLSSLELFRMEPGTGSGEYVGTFTLNSDGTMSFTKTTFPSNAPTLTAPASGARDNATFAVNYSLPVAAKPGTVVMDFKGTSPATGSHLFTMNSTGETAGAHSFVINTADGTGSKVASGTALPDGTYEVSISYEDIVGHPVSNAVVNTSVVVDTIAPVINVAGVATTGYNSTTALPNLIPSLVVTGSAVSTTQSPAAGSILPVGTHTITFTATDAAGNQATDSTVNITVATGTTNNTVQLKSTFGVGTTFVAGTPVPGAGTTTGIAKGAIFTSFGPPSINDAGQIAFLGQWTAPKTVDSTGQLITAAILGKGIFTCTVSNPTPTLVAYPGGPCGVTSGVLGSVMFDPVINSTGKVAFIASLANDPYATVPASPLIDTTNDLAVVTNAFTGGALTVAAREGSIVSGETDSPAISVISAISLQGSNLLYTTVLKTGTGAPVTTTNNKAAYMNNNGTVTRVIRAGVTSLPGTTGSSLVSAYTLLSAVAGSPGQTREHSGNVASLRVALVDKTVTLVDSTGGVITPFKRVGNSIDGTIGFPTVPVFSTFGTSVMTDGADVVVNGTLAASVPASVTGVNSKGIFKGIGSVFTAIARSGDIAPGGVGLFEAFGEPLVSGGTFAFPATAKLALVSKSGVFWRKSDGNLVKVAATTETAPGAPVITGSFKAFTSLGLSDNGPLFYGQLNLEAGITAANDNGIWAVDGSGALVKIVMEGDTIASGKVVKAITVLTGVIGSTGVTRSFNNNRQITYLATFVDGTKGIVTSLIP